MPLPKPTLDNRSFDQLVAEGRGLIPRLAPAWTDHNASDPGITLLELAAWLSEQNLYRLDRVTDEAQRGFLHLLGRTLRPPQVAGTVVVLGSTAPAPVALPERLRLSDGTGRLAFETTQALTVSPARLVRVLAGKPPLLDYTAQNAAPYDPAAPGRSSFPPYGPNPHPGAALYLGFDRALGNPGDRLSLHVWTPTLERDAEVRAALIAEEAERRRHAACPGGTPDWCRHYWACGVWEYFRNDGRWAELPGVEDETRALSLSGFVRFQVPGDQIAGEPEPFFFLRCRLRSGRFECPPRLVRAALNAVPAEHAATRDLETLGSGHGHAGESYAVRYPPVVAGSTALSLEQGTDLQTGWTEVPAWDRVGPHDRSYRLDPATGTIDFGDGRRGTVLPAGYAVRLAYRSGGGTDGNVGGGTLAGFEQGAYNQALVPGWAGLAGLLTLEQPAAAFGGAPAEPLRAAQAAAIEWLTRPRKAVTLADYEQLARETPGVPVGRAHALADRHPTLPCYPAPGCISVVIVPGCPGPAPLPSPAMLDAVSAYLGRRRLVTAEVHAVAPRYVRVGVYAVLHARSGTDAGALAGLAAKRLAGFFHPLSGGPEGRGWPIGRPVYRTEILQLLAALPGVIRVTDLGLRARGDAGPRCGNVEICASDLIAPGRHRLEIRVDGGAERLYRSNEHECP